MTVLDQFFHDWGKDLYSLTGSMNLHDLCWIARIAADYDIKQPLFPTTLQCLLTQWHPDGSLVKPSTLSYCNFITTLAFTNTLIIWNGWSNYNFTALIHATLKYIELQLTQIDHEFKDQTKLYDSTFKFTGLVGKWLLPAWESALLIKQGEAYLSEKLKKNIQAYANLKEKIFPPQFNFEKLIADNPLVFHFAECFSDEVLQLPLIKNHVDRVETLPGYTAAFSARYYQLTHHKKIKYELNQIILRPLDGLLPNRRLTEVVFILYYLAKANIDVAQKCNEQIDFLISHLHPNGIGVEPGTSVIYPDCDTSAVAQYVCHVLKLPLKMSTIRLNHWWNEALNCYQSSDGKYSYTTSTMMHVLDAYLSASDVTEEEKYTIWRRTLVQLENRSWEELHHISPYYIWEKIISIIFSHANKFPHRTTEIHYQALTALLKFQSETGGFYSHYLGKPTQEETAFALLALKSVLATPIENTLKQQIQTAVFRAEEFLLENMNNKNYPEFWVGKLLGTPTYVVEAIILASLHKPGSS